MSSRFLLLSRFDYEDSLEPFLSKLKNFTSASSANASVFRNTSLAFLETYSPLLVNETAQVSHVPASGRKDAFELGKQFEKYLGHLLPPWTDDKDNTSNQTYKVSSLSATGFQANWTLISCPSLSLVPTALGCDRSA